MHWSLLASRPLYFQSPVHENGIFYTEAVQCGTTSVHTEVERKYSEVAARGTPVFFRGNLSENLKTPQNIFALPRYVLMLFPTVRPRY